RPRPPGRQPGLLPQVPGRPAGARRRGRARERGPGRAGRHDRRRGDEGAQHAGRRRGEGPLRRGRRPVPPAERAAAGRRLRADAGLFLYPLLPILRKTAMALFTLDPVIKKVSVGMGLTAWQRLRYIELPLAAPTILAGIKTAAIINIGTATLAAYVGAGGLGDP